MYVNQIAISIYICTSIGPVCTNVNNNVIFVPQLPIYWSERINEVDKSTTRSEEST